MEDDWDLHAVVRGCAAINTPSSSAAATTTTSCTHLFSTSNFSTSAVSAATNTASCGQISISTFHQNCSFSTACFQDLFEQPRREAFVQELHDLYKPFFPKSQESSQIVLSPRSLPISPLSVLGGLQDPPSEQQQIVKKLPHQTQLRQNQQPFSIANGSKTSASHNPSSRSKRRKNHLKKICHVRAENLSSDMWSWRKYGQKPIKGSPYPRSYYRCSTSKVCMARKQVERNRSDPGMFIVTYTAEHNHPMPTHRNSLAGSTRQKPAEVPNNSDEPNKPSCSQETSPAASLSPAPEKLDSSREDLAEAEDDDDDYFSVSKMALDDDFFAGLEDFTAGECISGHIPANVRFPWLSNSATTIAGGG